MFVKGFLSRFGFRLALRVAERHLVSGIPVFAPSGTPKAEGSALSNVMSALACIGRYDPHRLARMQRDIHGILIGVARPGVQAFYVDALRLCVVDFDVASDAHPVHLATIIAHEAIYARLRCCPRDTPEQRARVERICVRAEIALASRIPGTEAFASLLHRSLAAIDPAKYTDESIQQEWRRAPRGWEWKGLWRWLRQP